MSCYFYGGEVTTEYDTCFICKYGIKNTSSICRDYGLYEYERCTGGEVMGPEQCELLIQGAARQIEQAASCMVTLFENYQTTVDRTAYIQLYETLRKAAEEASSIRGSMGVCRPMKRYPVEDAFLKRIDREMETAMVRFNSAAADISVGRRPYGGDLRVSSRDIQSLRDTVSALGAQACGCLSGSVLADSKYGRKVREEMYLLSARVREVISSALHQIDGVRALYDRGMAVTDDAKADLGRIADPAEILWKFYD